MASVKGQQRPETGKREKKYCRLSLTVTVAEINSIKSWLTLALDSGHNGPDL